MSQEKTIRLLFCISALVLGTEVLFPSAGGRKLPFLASICSLSHELDISCQIVEIRRSPRESLRCCNRHRFSIYICGHHLSSYRFIRSTRKKNAAICCTFHFIVSLALLLQRLFPCISRAGRSNIPYEPSSIKGHCRPNLQEMLRIVPNFKLCLLFRFPCHDPSRPCHEPRGPSCHLNGAGTAECDQHCLNHHWTSGREVPRPIYDLEFEGLPAAVWRDHPDSCGLDRSVYDGPVWDLSHVAERSNGSCDNLRGQVSGKGRESVSTGAGELESVPALGYCSLHHSLALSCYPISSLWFCRGCRHDEA